MKHFSTIETPAKGIATDHKHKELPKAAPKMPKGLGVTNATENSGAQESGTKKKRLHAVEAIKKPF